MAFGTFLRRIAAPMLVTSALVACSTDGWMPPEAIDGSATVSSLQPVPPGSVTRSQSTQTYVTASAPVATMDGAGATAGSGNYLRVPEQSYEGGGTQSQVRNLPMIDSDEGLGVTAGPGAPPQALAIPAGGVNMDEGLGVAQPVVGLAQEQSQEIAEGNASQPVVDGIGTDNPSMLQPAALPQSEIGQEMEAQPVWDDQTPVTMPSRPKRTSPQEQQVAFLGRPQNPMSAPQSQPEMPGVLPASERACRDQLRRMGVQFRDIPRISNGPTCGIDYPIELSGLSGGIAVKPATKLNCQLTLAFAKWVKYELAPSSRARYWSGVKTIVPMGGYSCRRMNSSSRNPWSEHARGNAIDVGKFVLKNGKQIDVRKKGFFAFREKGLLKAVRSDSCKYFNTVLGPGSDRNHKDHFHFDLRTRKTGYRHCD